MIEIVAWVSLVIAIIALAGAVYGLLLGYWSGQLGLLLKDEVVKNANSHNKLVEGHNKAVTTFNSNFTSYYDALGAVKECILDLDRRVSNGSVSEATLRQFIDIYNKEVALANAEVDTLINLSGEKPPPKGELN